MSGKLDITIEQGSTYSRIITIADENNNPINIANDLFYGQIRKHPKQDVVEASFTFSFYTDGSDGRIIATISDTNTSGITSGRNYYDIEWHKLDGTVIRLLEGVATVTAEVTR
jgi:hypothetical protein